MEEYNRWLAESEDLLDLAESFYRWSSLEMPEELRHLQDLLASVQAPPEPDWDSIGPWEEEQLSDYWSIEVIFEDL